MARGVSELELRRRLAVNVRRLRERSGLTMETAAEKADIAVRQWNRLENARLNTTLRTIVGVSRALGVDPAELLAGR